MNIFSIARKVTLAALIFSATATVFAQDESRGVVRRRDDAATRNATTGPRVTERMQSFYGEPGQNITDADRQWMRVIYRSIDLEKDSNAALYFPEEPIDGQENLFRIILRLVAGGDVAAYEYLDGREIFTDAYRVNAKDVLQRFYIPFAEARGSTERNPKLLVDENDVPTNEVLSYFVIERWEYDTRNNRLRPVIEAICPVLHRTGDFGGDALKYPMFWIKFGDLRPYLANQTIFVDDDNNLPTCTYDDFFTLNLYEGDIYKTRNLKNRSLAQLHPDPDNLRHAQDSIQAALNNFEAKLWVPSREEVIAAREAREALAAGTPADSTAVEAATSGTSNTRATRRSTKRSSKKVKEPKRTSGSSSSSATRSVRRTRR